jgi:hypothetical protein
LRKAERYWSTGSLVRDRPVSISQLFTSERSAPIESLISRCGFFKINTGAFRDLSVLVHATFLC